MRFMSKRHIITICGMLGSGKSTAAKRVATALEYPHYSGGDFARTMAKEYGVTLAELNARAEKEPQIDLDIDSKQKEFMETNDNFVIDSRLGWFFAPDSFKVFLNLDMDTAAGRIFSDMQAKKEERQGEVQTIPENVSEVKEKVTERIQSEKARYKKYYDIEDYQDLSHFDLVIDTKENGIPEVERLIVEGYKKWLTN